MFHACRAANPPSQGKSGVVPTQVQELGRLAVLIPAWQPDDRLLSVVRAVSAAGFGRVIVVDDGSSDACAPFFAAVEGVARVTLLRHAANRGKGRALKTGFEHLCIVGSELSGVVTADADGQHLPDDIVRVGRALLESDGPAVLGVRGFAGEIPFRSRFGNLLTQRMFALLTGISVADTQTGLRGLSLDLLPALVELDGERYEYEMNMLMHLCRGGSRPLEVAIATVYLENNRSSHFNPLWDSLRIYRTLTRFAAQRAGKRMATTGFWAAKSDRRTGHGTGKLPDQSPVYLP